jgi:nucleotide-binding universal stress UspA family protein
VLPVRKILAPTDFSSAADRSLETAAALGTCFGAELILLHVIEESAYPYPAPPLPDDRDAAKAKLDQVVQGLRARLLNATPLLREGVAWEEICACASRAPADLVVIGSQGRHGLPRLMLGSVAERVVRFAAVPVLTVHPSDQVAILAGGMDRFRHVLTSTDFSVASQRGVDVAAELAVELDAALTVVHVGEPPLRAQLDELVASLRARLPRVEGVWREGVVWQAILDVAKERRADLIVLSTHGRRGYSRLFLGSVAEKIVRLSHVPVLTVGESAAS